METVRNIIMDNLRQLLNDNKPQVITGNDGSMERLPAKIQIAHCGDHSRVSIITINDGVTRNLYNDGTVTMNMAYRWA